MHLWPERVVPKCATDRSLAIAHGLEDAFWYEDSEGKWQPRKVNETDVEKLVKERTVAAAKDALTSLLDAPAPPRSRSNRKKAPRTKGTRRNTRTSPVSNGASANSPASSTTDADLLLSRVKDAIAATGDGASRGDVIDATGITSVQWKTAITALLAAGAVTQAGEHRGARYHLAGGNA